MGMTMTQKILAKHAGLDSVVEGQLIRAKLDMVLGNDITSPVAINEFQKNGFDSVFDRTKISLVMDHFTPNKDIKAAKQCQQCRSFADKYDIVNYYDVGNVGIEHALLPEKGLVVPSDCVIGADSHTCTYGALGAFSTGVGSTDMALYQSMEFTGDGLKNLSMDDRLCMANMAIEAGAKNGIFEVDDVTLEYVKGRTDRKVEVFKADPDAHYNRVIDIDLSTIRPTVAFPHLPENTKTIDEIGKMDKIKIDQVVIGSCTNGRYSDLEAAAKVVKGKHVAKGVRAIVIPATQQIYLDALRSGLLETFVEAGMVVSAPTCGPCLGGHMGILAPGERAVSTTNRNFVGRMGDVTSEVYLASPAIAAASALTGYISDVQE